MGLLLLHPSLWSFKRPRDPTRPARTIPRPAILALIDECDGMLGHESVSSPSVPRSHHDSVCAGVEVLLRAHSLKAGIVMAGGHSEERCEKLEKAHNLK